MPTADQLQWLQDDLGIDESEATNLFARAEAVSTDYTIAEPLARVYYYSSVLNSSAKMVTYRKNHTEIKASDIFQHVKYLLERAEKKVAEAELAVLGEAGGVRSGRQSRIPRKSVEYPEGWLI